MNHAHHAEPDPTRHAAAPDATRLALDATRHCLTGCAIGEVLGLLISGALGLATEPAMLAGIGLAFVCGCSFTFVVVAFVATFPVNRWLIVRGRGHALAHGGHE
jgi:hypothetical protein